MFSADEHVDGRLACGFDRLEGGRDNSWGERDWWGVQIEAHRKFYVSNALHVRTCSLMLLPDFSTAIFGVDEGVDRN